MSTKNNKKPIEVIDLKDSGYKVRRSARLFIPSPSGTALVPEYAMMSDGYVQVSEYNIKDKINSYPISYTPLPGEVPNYGNTDFDRNDLTPEMVRVFAQARKFNEQNLKKNKNEGVM